MPRFDGTLMGGGATKTLATSPDESGMIHRVVINDDIIARGKRKSISTGFLIGSLRGGEKVVVKMLEESVPDENYWLNEINKCDILRNHVTSYRKCCKSNLKVHVEYAMTAYIDKVSKWMKRKMKLRVGEFVLIEELLHDKYTVFMSATGEMNVKIPENVSCFLSELMHYSYHASKRKEIASGFQGSYANGLLSLTEPTFHSVEQKYRETDRGMEGILIAFDNHRCTARCRNWLTPDEETFVKVTNGSPIVNGDIISNGVIIGSVSTTV